MKVQKNIDIYLLKKHQKRTIEVVQYDTGVQLVFSILDFDLPEGATATIYVRKKSGNCVYQECGVIVENNTVIVDLDNQALTEIGECAYQIKLMKDDDVVSTFAGIMSVAPSLADVDAVESKTVLSALDRAFEAKATEIFLTKANAIIGEQSGDTVNISDSSDSPIRNVSILGKSSQDGTPTPDAPVEITSTSDSGSVTVTVSDGGESSQTITILTAIGLYGIPVTSDGNYIDDNGQMWVCDEIDLARGVKVQRVYVLDCAKDSFSVSKHAQSNENFFVANVKTGVTNKKDMFCTHFTQTSGFTKEGVYMYAVGTGSSPVHFSISTERVTTSAEAKQWLIDNGVKIMHTLKTPVEVPLTDEQMADYSALVSYYPNTTATNDKGAGLKIGYNVDTKMYIDNKFAELSAAILGE